MVDGGGHVSLYYNGRTDRASLQIVTRWVVTRQLLLRRGFDGNGRTDRASLQKSSLRVPTTGYTSCCTTTDAQTVRPYKSLPVGLLPVGSLHNTK